MNLFQNLYVIDLKVFSGDFQKKESVQVGPRPFCSLTYRTAGTVHLSNGDTDVVSLKDTVTFVPAGTAYSTEVEEDGSMIIIHFKVAKIPKGLGLWVSQQQKSSILKSCFDQILKYHATKGHGSPAVLASFYEILTLLEKEREDAEPPRNKRVRHILGYVEESFKDPGLSVAQLAERAGVSTTYLRRLFKEALGVSPVDHITSVRLKHARLMLRDGFFSVAEIASACGFYSPSYFSYVFHRIEGISPSQYAKQYSQRL